MKELLCKWEPFLEYGQRLEVKRNKMIYRQGEQGKGFYYLLNGEIKITLLSDKGDERIINMVPPGMLFGEHGFQKEPYLTSAAATCQSVLYLFSDEAVSQIVSKHPDAAVIYTDSLIYKLRTLAEILSLIECPIEQQMAYYLLKLYNENENASINQTSFAKYLGKSRITVNKVIQSWKEKNLIELKKRKIQLLDIRSIKEIASHRKK
ncbi:Crp/Fnr family transcriptional regulator [Heyndrickxia acidicola]|uniref:Crp/Fnr family transcriptional regulator n=1 Tax=Heyndrickxia acidicola TaxID=209389 RepID=A0ABU6MJA2_9BACI|nr:Crp/Fnr family transcriptional regulator [Heyndrickxia acidicola]MED1204487.1 Crp/Fnr family transcriptional regulator [Heyndrickxia acidicola]